MSCGSFRIGRIATSALPPWVLLIQVAATCPSSNPGPHLIEPDVLRHVPHRRRAVVEHADALLRRALDRLVPAARRQQEHEDRVVALLNHRRDVRVLLHRVAVRVDDADLLAVPGRGRLLLHVREELDQHLDVDGRGDTDRLAGKRPRSCRAEPAGHRRAAAGQAAAEHEPACRHASELQECAPVHLLVQTLSNIVVARVSAGHIRPSKVGVSSCNQTWSLARKDARNVIGLLHHLCFCVRGRQAHASLDPVVVR